MKNCRFADVVVVGTLLFFSMPSQAETSEKKEARKMLEEGNRLYEQSSPGEALAWYLRAYERSKEPKVLKSIGNTYEKLNRFAEAAAAYEEYLADPTSDPECVKRDPACREKLKTQLRAVLKKVATLRIEVSSDDGARVTVAGRDVGRTPGTITTRVDPGVYSVRADDGRSPPMIEEVTVAAGEDKLVRLRREKEAPAIPPTSPVPPPTPVPAEAPSPVPAAAPTPVPEVAPVPVPAAAPTRIVSPPPSATYTNLGYLSLGLGAVSVAGGAVFLQAASSKNGEYHRAATSATDAGRCDAACQDNISSLKRDRDSKATTSYIAFGLGGAFGVAGALLILAPPSKSVSVAPAVGPGIAGLTARGAF